jgi:hypothetical protein
MQALSTIPTAPTGRARERCSPPARARGVAVDLSPQAVEQVATRVAQLLAQRRGAPPELLSAGELARRLRVERPWVYRHRALLGGMRIGAGPKAPWRFDYEQAVAALQAHQQSQDTRRKR